jgi:hypothetical protein
MLAASNPQDVLAASGNMYSPEGFLATAAQVTAPGTS